MDMDLKRAQRDARECKAGARMANAFERHIKILGGNSRRTKKNWISFQGVGKMSECSTRYIYVGYGVLEGWRNRRSRFEKAVDQIYPQYLHRGLQNISSSLPQIFALC